MLAKTGSIWVSYLCAYGAYRQIANIRYVCGVRHLGFYDQFSGEVRWLAVEEFDCGHDIMFDMRADLRSSSYKKKPKRLVNNDGLRQADCPFVRQNFKCSPVERPEGTHAI
jgi:hypothetical protein